MRMSQSNRIIAYMQEHGSITTMEAFEKLRITRLPARIADIIERGYRVEKETVRNGREWFVRYSLAKEDE